MRRKKRRRQIKKIAIPTILIMVLLLGVAGIFVHGAEKKVGIKKTLAVSPDAGGKSYLNYISPVSGEEFRVSLHETTDGLMAYCLERTKDSDYHDYNYNYELISKYAKEESDLQRNILLCGYPGNTVRKLEELYGYEVNARSAAQATQMAIWVGNYMYEQNVSMEEAWKAHKAKNTGEYEAAQLGKAILEKAYDMLGQDFQLSYQQSRETEDKVTYEFVIKTRAQYYPLTGTLTGLPEGAQVTASDGVSISDEGSVEVNLVNGETKISVTFSRYVNVPEVKLILNGTIPIPPSYAGILYYKNTDPDYQSVVVVKEVEPTYVEKAVSFSRKADQQMIISVKKEDSEGQDFQGDATLVGAEYTIYDLEGKEREVLTIGDDGRAASGRLPIGIYTVKETKSPEGYNLDETLYTIDGTKGDKNLDVVPFEVVSKEAVIQGKIRIVKDLENPDSESEEKIAAEGVVFTYYLNSRPEEKMKIVLDENGIGESDWMPYGTYTLEETEVPEGWKAVAPRVVKIENHKKTLTYYMTDAIDSSECKIIKKDSETGNVIKAEGIRFQIRKKSTGEIVFLNVKEPVKAHVSEFVTNEEGYLILPEKLQAGDYLLYELEAPEGYVKAKEPVEFQVPYLYEGTVEIVMENRPITCRLIVEKTGPVLVRGEKQEWEGYEVLMPVYEDKPLAGVKYELVAVEEMKTLDGTVRMKKGESVNAVTDQEGKAVFEELYPGKYELRETETLDGYILNKEEKIIHLKVADSEKSVQESKVSCQNDVQKMSLLLQKQMEQKENDAVEDALEAVVFGLYSKEVVVNLAGKEIIPANTLLDIYKINADGHGVSQLNTEIPYGTYYVKELKTHPEYVLDENRYDFTFRYLKESGEKQEISLTEEPIVNQRIAVAEEITKEPEQTEMPKEKSPKTGDEAQLFLWIVCAFLSVAAIGMYYFLVHKKTVEII